MLDSTLNDGWRRSLVAATDEHLMALVRPEDRSEVAFEPSVRGLAVRTLPFIELPVTIAGAAANPLRALTGSDSGDVLLFSERLSV